MSVSNFFPYAQPSRVILDRLSFHADPDAAGRLLSGVTFDREGKIEQKQERQMPMVQPFETTMSEGIFAGAGESGRGTRMMTLEHYFWVETRVANGWVGTGSADPKKWGACEGFPRVIDAIETAEDGTVDPLLDGCLARPMSFQVNASEMTHLSWGTLLQVTVYLSPSFVGHRSRI